MSCEILMITEQEVKNLTSITNNVDFTKFCPHIPVAQLKHIRPLIGEPCYAELLNQIENSTLTAANTILLDGDDRNFPGIKKVLAWWILWEAYPDLYSTITPTGIQTKSDGNLEPISSSVLSMRMNQAKVNAEMYGEQVICYICDNTASYPCSAESGGCCDSRQKSGYESSGVVLDDTCTICGCTDLSCNCD